MKTRWQTMAAVGTGIYAALAGLWIGLSDWTVGWLAGDVSGFWTLSLLKGALFVAVTSLTLYVVLRRLLRTETEARTQAEEVARQLNELKVVAEQSNEVLYKHDLDNRFTYASPQCHAVLGYGPEDLGTQWITILTANPLNQHAYEATQKALQTGEKQPPYLVEVRRKDGHLILMEIDEAPLKDADGKVVAIAGAARDVTQRETAEKALRQSEERFRRLAESMSDVFWMADIDLSHIHYVSPAFEKTWGRSCESLYKNPKLWLDSIHPDDREHALAALWVDRGTRSVNVEYRIMRPDGSMRWIHDHAFPLKNQAGVVTGMAGLAKDVTERKSAQDALRQSEEKLRTLYTSMNEGLVLHELVSDASGNPVDYRILDANPAASILTNVPREQLLGALGSTVFGSGPPFLDIYASVAQSGTPTEFESFFAPLGKHYSISVFSPRRGQFATVFSDITQRKEAEQQLSMMNRVFALVSNINEAIVRIGNRDTLFGEACRVAVEDGGFPLAWIGLLEESTGAIRPVTSWGRQGLSVEVPAAILDQEMNSPGLEAVREGRVIVISDIARDERAGTWRETAISLGYRSSIALPLKLGNRSIGVLNAFASEPNFFSELVTESLIEVTSDISFALELFEKNRQRELEQHQLRLQHSALDAAANSIIITSRTGEIEWVNEAFTRLTGFERNEAIGQNPKLLRSGVHDREFYRCMWETVLAGNAWQGTLTNRRKDGTLYDEEMTITPVRGRNGEVEHFIGIKQDVTERRKLEQQLLRAQRTQSIGLLAGGVAHDLNNVLAPVLMSLPLLRGNLLPEQRDHILDMLEQSVKRGANIIRQVLTFARGVEVQRTQVQPRHLLREVARIVEETFPKDIQIQCVAPSTLWLFQGDPTQIHQVLLNLVVNARDAMPNGGNLVLAAANVEESKPVQFMDFEIPPGRYISIRVADTGSGIDPKTLERIFEPFFTTKPAGKGTGLGLSTVLGIVKSHGGLVRVETKPGAGSTFTVLLPASKNTAQASTSPEPATPLPRGNGETVLLVDDEPGVLQVTRSTLESNGYQVEIARDGAQAIAMLKERGQSINAIVTDIMMPHMDGLALTRTLRKSHPSMPIVAATGLLNPPGEEDRAGQLRKMGVSHFLHKPFHAEELLTALRQVLNKSTDS
jgi:PAS domain S-box-containing protein